MGSGNCALGEDRPQICKDFPRRQEDIDSCGASLGENSTCVAEIGGEGCNHCGQCCMDRPWPKQGCPETNGENWIHPNGVCIHFLGGA